MYTSKKFLHTLEVIQVLCDEIVLFWDIWCHTVYYQFARLYGITFQNFQCCIFCSFQVVWKCTFLNVWYLYLYSKICCRVLITFVSAKAFLDDVTQFKHVQNTTVAYGMKFVIFLFQVISVKQIQRHLTFLVYCNYMTHSG